MFLNFQKTQLILYLSFFFCLNIIFIFLLYCFHKFHERAQKKLFLAIVLATYVLLTCAYGLKMYTIFFRYSMSMKSHVVNKNLSFNQTNTRLNSFFQYNLVFLFVHVPLIKSEVFDFIHIIPKHNNNQV